MVLELEDVHAYYGESHVLQGVTLGLAPGSVSTLLGLNGAGKSTTLRTIMGVVPPRQGTIRLHGSDVTGLPPYAVSRRGIGWVPEDRQVFSRLSVLENLEIARRRPRGTRRARWTLDQVFSLFPVLGSRQRQLGGTLSGGEQQMLVIGRALMGDPDVLLLDEPSEGLGPQVIEAIEAVLRELTARGMGVLLVEQNIRFALSMARSYWVLAQGRIVFEGLNTKPEESFNLVQRRLSL